MRIISDYHDYYDTLQRYDLEHDDIYHRKQEEIKTPKSLLNHESVNVIGFCGKFYPFIYGDNLTTIFDLKIIRNFVRRSRYYVPSRFYSWLDEVSRKTDNELFITLETPILVTNGNTTTINPCLRTYNFQSQVDPYTAWNTLDRFRMEHFRIQEPMSMTISDLDLAKKKGLQGRKYDFRRPPTKANKRKKKRK